LLLQRYEAGDVVLQDTETGECRTTKEGKLLEAIFAGQVTLEGRGAAAVGLDGGELVLKDHVRRVTARAVEILEAKLTWINVLRRQGITNLVDEPWVRTEMARLAAGELKLVPRFTLGTLYAAELAIRKAGGDVSAALPDYASRGGAGQARIDARTLEKLHAVITTARDRKPPKPIITRDIWRDTNALIEEANKATSEDPIPPASETTTRREVRKLVPAYTAVKNKYGTDEANDRYRVNSSSRDRAMRPLEISEYDDIDAAVFLTDERTGLPWGRAFVTNGIDQNCDLILGYDLSDKPRNYASAIGALCDSLLPKADCAPGEMGYGCQGLILMDNASYNECKAMKHQSAAMRILLSAARPFGPTEKSSIEHFNHRVKKDFCPQLPGWRGEKGDREAVDRGIATAVTTVAEFAQMYRHWLTDVYANTPGKDGLTPRQRWLRYYAKHGPAVRYTPQQLALFRLRPERLTFRDSGGLMRLQLRYDSDALAELRRHLGHTAEVIAYVDPNDLTYLMVLNPVGGSLLRVPCTEDVHYVRHLTEAQQIMILAIARERGAKNPSLADLQKGRDRLQQMVEEARRSNRMRTRQWARRIGPVDKPTAARAARAAGAPATAPAPTAESRIVTDLEYQILELQEVELTKEDQW